MSQTDEPLRLRAYREDAYDEATVSNADDFVKIYEKKAQNVLNRAAHYAGIFIVIAVALACILIILRSSDDKQQFDLATKLIFLIVGAVLGRIFPNMRSSRD